MYKKKAHVHFLGIGGIGMSGIATVLKQQGYTISGCDTDLEQSSVRQLQEIGCAIYRGNNSPECARAGADVLVYSSAVTQDHPEIVAARARGIPAIPRALMLAELMRTKYSIAVAGSHGKTTTTSLVSHILIEAGLDPTVIIGGHLKSISHNARCGTGDFLVAEADESDRSLVSLHATIGLVTNIDLEHLETYKDLDDIKKTFDQFLHCLPFYGLAVICDDDPGARSLLPISHVRTITYGTTPRADLYATDLTLRPDSCHFVVHRNGTTLGPVTLAMPGAHNALNALGAIALAHALEVPFSQIQKALASFKGVERRFSFNGSYRGAQLFDDYGHHPNEIHHVLTVARARAKGKLIVIFQPHRYTRTHMLWDDFVSVFCEGGIDHLVLTDIYPASELPIPGITSKRLARAIDTRKPPCCVDYIPFENTFEQLRGALDRIVQEGDLVLLLGAGKVNTMAPILLTPPSNIKECA